MNKPVVIIGIILFSMQSVYAYDTTYSPEIVRSYGKQQIKTTDTKGNTKLVTPNYANYSQRNNEVSEKIVAIYDKKSPAYGYRYVLYSPIGNYVGHHKIMQPSLNGYGYDPVPEGGEGSDVPCFKTIQEAKHYHYPEWY